MWKSAQFVKKNKSLVVSPAGLLLSLSILDVVWENVSMDFIEGLPKYQGYDVIFVVVDRLTKYSHFVGLKHPFSARLLLMYL